MRLLVVGGDAAGMSAASTVRRGAPDVEVTVVERGSYTSYSMCGIPYLVAGDLDDPEQLVAKSPEAFRAMGMTVQLHTEAVSVDAGARTVRVRDRSSGQERDQPYDELLVATGAHPRPQNVPGLDRYGHVVHTLDEGMHVRRHFEQRAVSGSGHPPVQRVVVVGAGYIGMEIAEALVRHGLSAMLVDRSPQVMKSLDPDMAAHVERALRNFSIDVRLGESLIQVDGDDQACTQVTTDRGVYPADAVILAMGGKPNLELALTAGCEVGVSGGLLVDDRQRTTVGHVWAAGDCVEHTDLVAGLRRNVQLGTHANKQGKVAGHNLVARFTGASEDVVFPGVVGTAVTKICDWEIARVGLLESDAREVGLDYAVTAFKGTARAGYMPDPGEVFVKMMAERGSGRVLGCQLVGTGNVAKRIDVAATWCQLGVTVQTAQLLDLSYAPPFGGVWDLLQVAARKLAKDLGLHPAL